MLDAEEAVELRALQARAYGPAGGLSASDARRLSELTAKRAGESRAVDGTPSAAVPPDVEFGAEIRAEQHASPAERMPRRSASRLLLPAIALVVVFGLGALAGWFLTRPAEHRIELNATQLEWQNTLIDSGEYDAGSVEAVAVEDDVVIWVATTSRGLQTCLVLGDAEQRMPSCTSTDHVHSSGFEAVRTVDGEGDLLRQVSARLFLTDEGEPAVVSSSYLYAPADDSDSPYRDDDEAAIAERLVSLGLDRTTLGVAGYDDETPIWTGTWTTSGQTCLVYDGSQADPHIACDEVGTAGIGGRGLGMEHIDDETGQTTSIMFMYGDGPSYLQVTRQPNGGGLG